jgi:hypothetical protein
MAEYKNKINIIMIGHTGAGKSQLGNSILQREVFEVGHGNDSKTEIKKEGFGTLNGLDLRIIDTRGFSDTKENEQDHKDDWKKIAELFVIDLSIDGIIFVFNFTDKRKGQQYKNLIQKLKELFGTEILKQRLKIVFTNSKYGLEYEEEMEEIQANEMIKLIGSDIIGRNDMIFVNTHIKLIKHDEFKYFDKITELIKQFSIIKEKFGSMDNQKVEMKRKELEEKEKQKKKELEEKERQERLDKEDKQRIKIAQLSNIHNDIISYKNMISQKKNEIEDYKRRIEGAKKGLIASSIFTPFTLGFSGFGIAHCKDEMNSFKDSISRLKGELSDCESNLRNLENEQTNLIANLNIN